MSERYYVEFIEYDEEEQPVWQSVFPSHMSEHSQLHTSVIDARQYIREIAGDVDIIVEQYQEEDTQW